MTAGRWRVGRLLALALVVAAIGGCGGGRATPMPTAVPVGVEATTPTAPEGTPEVSAPPGAPPTPLVSRGKPVFAARGVATPGAINDGRYCAGAAWRATTFPSWLAIRVGAGPSRLLVSWQSGGADDYAGERVAGMAGLPATYALETSADSTDGADGAWVAVATVTDNRVRTRGHSIPFAGMAWVRMTVAGVPSGVPDGALMIDEIDFHDISAGAADSVFFLGDSITVGAHGRCDTTQPSYAALVNRAYPAYFPAMIGGGVGGVTSAYGLQQIDRLLAENPDYRVWAIAYGTNDAFQGVPTAQFERQMAAIIERVQAAGKEPVLARIPYATAGGRDATIRDLNAAIDRLTARYGLRPGPDLYGWFKAHPDELAPDGIHPEFGGSKSISRLWFEALRGRYGAR